MEYDLSMKPRKRENWAENVLICVKLTFAVDEISCYNKN